MTSHWEQIPLKTPDAVPATDLERWRLKVDDGRQTWHYLHNDNQLKDWPQTDADRYWLGLSRVRYSL